MRKRGKYAACVRGGRRWRPIQVRLIYVRLAPVREFPSKDISASLASHFQAAATFWPPQATPKPMEYNGADGISGINSAYFVQWTWINWILPIQYRPVVVRRRTVRLAAVKEGYSGRRVPHIQITGTYLCSSPLTYGQQLSPPDGWHIFKPIMWGSVGIIRCIRLRLSALVSHKGEADADGCAFLL